MSSAVARMDAKGSQLRAGMLLDAQTFAWQSYFDNTLLEKAIVVQPAGTRMISLKDQQFKGHSLVNSPSSQVPIAVTGKVTGAGGSISVFVLAPGQGIAPFDDTDFREFTWGLPFGWLGGGMAQLLVSQQREFSGYSARPEIPFHRARFAIKQPSDLTSVGYNNSPLNWPLRFPWVAAVNAQSNAQNGSPLLGIEPTRIVMALRGLSTLAIAAPMIAIIQGSDDFCLDPGGVPSTGASGAPPTMTNPLQDEFLWPAFFSYGTSGNLATQNIPLDFGPEHPLCKLGVDGIQSSPSLPAASIPAVGVTFVDASGAGVLAGAFVDVVRYGRI